MNTPPAAASGLGTLVPHLADLLSVWEHAGSGEIPLRSHLLPEQLGPWMGWLVLVDVIEGGIDFRFRVYGSALATRLGEDITGRLVSELAHDLQATTMNAFRRVVDEGHPIAQVIGITRSGRAYRWQRLVMPLRRREAGPTDQLLIGVVLLDDN